MNSISVLERHPQLHQEVEKAKKLPPLPLDYSPAVVEVFDQLGVIAGMAFGVPYECDRSFDAESEFIAWYLDGELALFYIRSEVLVNRLEYVETAAELLKKLEEV